MGNTPATLEKRAEIATAAAAATAVATSVALLEGQKAEEENAAAEQALLEGWLYVLPEEKLSAANAAFAAANAAFAAAKEKLYSISEEQREKVDSLAEEVKELTEQMEEISSVITQPLFGF